MKLTTGQRYSVNIPELRDRFGGTMRLIEPAQAIEGKFYFYHWSKEIGTYKKICRRSEPGESKAINREQEVMIETDDGICWGVSSSWIGEAK